MHIGEDGAPALSCRSFVRTARSVRCQNSAPASTVLSSPFVHGLILRLDVFAAL
jgi:hypothetical protein